MGSCAKVRRVVRLERGGAPPTLSGAIPREFACTMCLPLATLCIYVYIYICIRGERNEADSPGHGKWRPARNSFHDLLDHFADRGSGISHVNVYRHSSRAIVMRHTPSLPPPPPPAYTHAGLIFLCEDDDDDDGQSEFLSRSCCCCCCCRGTGTRKGFCDFLPGVCVCVCVGKNVSGRGACCASMHLNFKIENARKIAVWNIK